MRTFYYMKEITTGKFLPNGSWSWGISWLNCPPHGDLTFAKQELLSNTPTLYQSKKVLEEYLKRIQNTHGMVFEIKEVKL